MAKTPTEHIRDLTAQVRVLEDRDAARREALKDLKGRLEQQEAEQKAADEKFRDEVIQLRSESADARQETALVKQLLQEHIKRFDLADSRRWALVILALGAIFSLATGLIVTLVRK